MTLQAGSLRDTIDDIYEIDSFKSKMGDDSDIITLSFSLTTNESAKDLNSFIESGYSFVLDSDVTAGEQSDGTYKVFVEIERDKACHENINEIIDGVKKLCALDSMRFRYYKNFRSREHNLDNLKQYVPNDSKNYGINRSETAMENYKNFFNKSFVEDISMYKDIIKFKKAYADPIEFEMINFDDKKTVRETIEGKFDLVESYPEILFLTKYIGDYNISKYGDSLVFENEDKALVLKRI